MTSLEAIATLLLWAAVFCCLVGGFWLHVEAFKQSRRWGWCCALIPFATLVFVVRHWKVAKWPFGLYLLEVLFFVCACPLLPDN